MGHHRVGNQRRIYLRDVLESAKKRGKERLSALDLLALLSSLPAKRNVLAQSQITRCLRNRGSPASHRSRR
jgi:hypothetical protein